MRYVTIAILTVSSILFLTLSGWADGMWTDNGVPACTMGGQENSQLISDGLDGAILVWQQLKGKGGEGDIYVQHFNGKGQTSYFSSGVAVCTAANSQVNPQLVSDNNSGAIIVWQDGRSGSNYVIYTQRIDLALAPQLASNGIVICNQPSYTPQIASDGTGGAIMAWVDYRSGAHYDIYAQRITNSGIQWAVNGVKICDVARLNSTSIIQMASDGNNGAFIVWADSRGGTLDAFIYAQRVDSTGAVKWTPNGILISSGANDRKAPQVIPDGNGGAFIAWADKRTGNYDIYAQHVGNTGTAFWTPNGLLICNALAHQNSPHLISDSSGGAIISWDDTRNSPRGRISAQRVSASGALLWPSNGIQVCDSQYFSGANLLVPDGNGGAIITWADSAINYNCDRAQRVDSFGNAKWRENGLVLAPVTGDAAIHSMIFDNHGGAIMTWRYGVGIAYAQRLVRSRPHPTSINSPAVPGGVFRATILGDGFKDDRGEVTAIKLTRASSADIASSSLVVAGANSLTCNFDLSSATSGDWSVVLTDSLQQSSSVTLILRVLQPNTAGGPSQFLKTYHNQINPNLHELAIIKWIQPSSNPVTIIIYNLLGDKVVTLADHAAYSEGQIHQITWDGKNQYGQVTGSGIYIVHLKTTGYEDYAKIAVVK